MIRNYEKCMYFLITLIIIETLYMSLYDVNQSSIDVFDKGLDCNVASKNDSKPISRSKGTYLFYIQILSAPHNWLRRQEIRNTWGYTARQYPSVKYMFLIGNIGVSESNMSAVQKETAKFGDILILSGIEEKFTKLSRKVLKGFVWAGEHIDAVYYIKTDDDCYVFIENLFIALTTENIAKNKLLMGLIHRAAPVEPKGKWAEHSWFLCPNYLPYPAGAMYIITQDIVNYLTLNSERLMHYNNDDVALGSWLAPLKVEFQHDLRVKVYQWKNSYACTHWLRHGLSPKTMNEMHFKWLKMKDTCKK